jgi:hypothetical protein
MMAALVALSTATTVLSKDTDPFPAKETSLDLFASYLAPEHGIGDVFKTNIRGGTMGGGMGVNYFFSRTTGLGTDINIGANGGSFVDSTSVNLIQRFPIGTSGMAPYVIGGGGRSYDPTEWIGQVGLGVELRSEGKSGIFVDGRYVWGEKGGTDKLMLRAGLRLKF